MPGYLDEDPPGFDGYEDELDPEGPSRADIERFGDAEHACSSCGSEVYEDAPLCHVCGHALEDRSGGPPLWAAIVAVVLLGALMMLFVF